MKNVNENLAAFLRVLDPCDDSTGGGTASAIAGAMAGALVAMVARLSVGRDGMREKAFYEGLGGEAQEISEALFDGGRDDSQAFDAVRQAYRLPKKSDEEKASRHTAIQEAIIQATLIPLANTERCWRVIELARKLERRFNPNLASDLECAIHLARAGLLGCAANVAINVPTIKDVETATELAGRAHELTRLIEEHDG
ncbi:MAG: cyclodeaminase/cyclohydrolase family protein [Anaerolineales bacterium]